MITQSVCLSYCQELLEGGIHEEADTYKIALYTSAANLGINTTVYAGTDEVPNGSGYTTGGETLTGVSIGSGGGQTWFDANNPSWAAATFTARGALIYNSSKANRAVMVIDFGSDQSVSGGTFTVVFPAPAANTALLRLEPV